MQFSPLQSRLVASLAATLCLVVVYYLLTSPIGAFAADVDVRTEPWLDLGSMGIGFSDATEKSYEPFFGSLMGNLENRAVGDTIPLQNNKPLGLNIPPQKLICYTVKASDISKGSSKRDDVGAGAAQDTGGSASNSTIYISANTCQRPTPGDNSGKGGAVPQMALFVSNTKSATGCPDESVLDGGKTPDGFEQITFEEGAATFAANATDDIYVGVWAPKVPSGMQGQYSYEVAASIDGFFHQYLPSLGRAELLWLDSDSTSALLVSRNLTDDESQIKKVMSEDPPYDLYVGVQGSQDLDGLWNSACGLQLNAIIGANKEGTAKNNTLVKNVVTLRGPGDFPKQQLYVVGLNGTTNYAGVLVRPSNVTLNSKRDIDGSGAAGQGSVVFQATNFSTNSAPNCKVVTNLEFCDEIQYAVPGNDNKFNNTALAKAYDDQAKAMYANFDKALQQIQCETDKTSKYSLTRTCDDCKQAYKRWLCTVSMPRCEDFTQDSQFGFVRNAWQPFPNGTKLIDSLRDGLIATPYHNNSRSSFIDDEIQPGPYKEILPCEYLCYEVVQSCPAALGFVCPQPGMQSFDYSYGRKDDDSSTVSCNYPGEARTPLSGAGVTAPDALLVAVAFLASAIVLV